MREEREREETGGEENSQPKLKVTRRKKRERKRELDEQGGQ